MTKNLGQPFYHLTTSSSFILNFQRKAFPDQIKFIWFYFTLIYSVRFIDNRSVFQSNLHHDLLSVHTDDYPSCFSNHIVFLPAREEHLQNDLTGAYKVPTKSNLSPPPLTLILPYQFIPNQSNPLFPFPFPFSLHHLTFFTISLILLPPPQGGGKAEFYTCLLNLIQNQFIRFICLVFPLLSANSAQTPKPWLVRHLCQSATIKNPSYKPISLNVSFESSFHFVFPF